MDKKIKIFILYVTINSSEYLLQPCLLSVHASPIIFYPLPPLARALNSLEVTNV